MLVSHRRLFQDGYQRAVAGIRTLCRRGVPLDHARIAGLAKGAIINEIEIDPGARDDGHFVAILQIPPPPLEFKKAPPATLMHVTVELASVWPRADDVADFANLRDWPDSGEHEQL